MVFKKYTYKDGKKYGPYLYENKRVNGKVVSVYLGPAKESEWKDRKKVLYGVFGISILLVFLVLFFVFQGFLIGTGKATLDIKSQYNYGEQLSGKLNFNLKSGELVPKDSVVIFSLGNETKEFVLSELVDLELVSGEFYAENSGISGSGEGYGLIGKKEFFPEVSFELLVFDSEDVSVGGGEVEEEGGKVVEKQEEKAKNVTEEVSEEIIEEEEVGNITEEPSGVVEKIPEEIVEETPERAVKSGDIEIEGNLEESEKSEEENKEVVGGEEAVKVSEESKVEEECYDSETEILTSDGWKLFEDLEGNEKVMTLNAETGEKEWEKPRAYQEFDHDGEMYKIILENGDEMVVSGKHKVYGRVIDKNYSPLLISSDLSFSSEFNISSVLNIFILSCLENAFSSDQIGHLLNARDNAKYWISLECGVNDSASDLCILNSSNEIVSTCSLINVNTSDSSFLMSLLLNTMSSKFLPISKNMNSGDINWNFFESEFSLNTSNALPLESNDEYMLLVSTITNILNYSNDSINLFDSDLSVFSDNSLISSLVNFERETIDLSLANLSNSDLIILVMAKDNFIFDNFLRSDSNSSGIDIVTFAIGEDISNEYIKVSNFELLKISEIYENLDMRQLIFLDSKGDEVAIKKITKIPYKGKIYDVDVGNNIVLVKRARALCTYNENKNNSESFFVDPIVVIKVKKDNSITFYLKDENKTSNLDSLKITQVMPKIFEMFNADYIKLTNLNYFVLEGFEKNRIFTLEFSNGSFNSGNVNFHNELQNLLNSSIEIDEDGSLVFAFNFSTYSSFNSNSSIGYQSILSQNSWSSFDNVPVFLNLSNMSRFINLTTALAINSGSNLRDLINSFSIEKIGKLNYINFSLNALNEDCNNYDFDLTGAVWSGNSDSAGEIEVEEFSESESAVESGSEAVGGESAITGASITEREYIVSGVVSKDNNFEYNLEEGQNARIVSGSVKVNGNEVDENNIKLNVKDNKVDVSTEYLEIGEGFGEEYLGDELLILEVDVSKFGFVVTNDTKLNVKLIYDNNSIVGVSKDIIVEEEVIGLNESIGNLSEINQSYINATSEYVSVNITQFEAVIGKPVKWLERIETNGPAIVRVELPENAVNISVGNIIENKESFDSQNLISGNVIVNTDINAKYRVGISGEVVSERASIFEFVRNLFRITGFVVSNETQEILVEINDSSGGVVEVEYYTDAPTAFEEEMENGKKVSVSSPDNVRYTNVLVFANISESFNVRNSDNLQVYWIENNSYLTLNALDTNSNGIIDYIEWVTPHLSNQTFEIIVITKAEHLDENRTFIEDVYEEVKERDNITKEIPAGHYVRVTFEKNLTKEKDITIYAKSNYTNVSVEVYEINETELIADFGVINNDKEYKIFLTNLIEEQDTFDLKVIGGSVEFDWIVDPTINVGQVNQTGGIQNNITCENYPLCHITLNDSSVVLYMPFDVNTTNSSGGGNVYDYSVNNNDGLEVGSVGSVYWKSPAIIGGGYTFNQADGFISIDSITSDLASITEGAVSIWVNLTEDDGADHVFFSISREASSTQTELWLNFRMQSSCNCLEGSVRVDGAGQWTFRSGDGFMNSRLGQWIHIAVVHNGTEPTFYSNGTVVSGSFATDVNRTKWFKAVLTDSTSDADTANLGMLERGTTDVADFGGEIDEVMVFNRTLSAAEITNIFNNQTYRFITPASQLFSINFTAGDNRANITTNSTLLFGSNISLRLREYEGATPTTNTTYQNITDGDNKISIFNISTATNNLTLEFVFNSWNGNQSGNFYSPVLRDNIQVDTWNVSAGGADTTVPVVNLISPTNGTTVTTNITFFFASFTDNVNVSNATLYLWNQTGSLVNTNFTGLGNSSISANISLNLNLTGTYFWNYLAVDNSSNQAFNNSNFTLIFSTTTNNAPNAPSPDINSTLGTNKTAQDLKCFDTISDPDGDRLNVTVQWFNQTVLHWQVDFNESFANNTLFTNATLDDGNTTKGQNWTCGMRLFDGTAYSSWVNTTYSVNITNTAPSIPSLSTPADASNTTDRTPNFTWTASSDDDSDTITYDLNVTLIAASTCSELSRHVTSIAGASYTISGDLQCLYDNNDYYNWSVRAYDGTDYSSWTSFFRINITAEIIISLPNNSVTFGDINFLATNDTTDNSPLPLLIQNDGNAFVNITINASDLWRKQANPSQYYQYKVDNYTFENGSFNWALSKISYTNVPAGGSPSLCIARLNYTDATDTAEVDINVTVPADEGSGYRNSIISFVASLGE